MVLTSSAARYRIGARAVLFAAQDVRKAWDAGDEDRAYAAANSLLDTALARESGGVVAGFEGASLPIDDAPPETADVQLARVLAEIEIGDVLLTASVPPSVAKANPSAKRTLTTAMGILDEVTTESSEGVSATSAFRGGREFNRNVFLDELPKTVKLVVDGTEHVGKSAFSGLAAIPVAQLQPVFAGVLSAVPNFRAIAQAGMRAIKRAVEAILSLVPQDVRNKITALAKEWWEKAGGVITAKAVHHVLALDELEAEIKTRTQAVRDRPNGIPLEPLRQGWGTLQEVQDRFSRTNKIISSIVSALSRLIGPLVALIPTGAPWIYVTGGVGLLAATGAAVWVGRDYLDAGVPFERVVGVRAILRQAIPDGA